MMPLKQTDTHFIAFPTFTALVFFGFREAIKKKKKKRKKNDLAAWLTPVLYTAVRHTPHFLFLPDASKTDVPEDFDIDMEDPETEKAAVAIQSQFRKFQKKKRVEKS